MFDGLRMRCWSFMFKTQSISPARFHIMVATKSPGLQMARGLDPVRTPQPQALHVFRLFRVEIGESGGKATLAFFVAKYGIS
jgi:hypothetical protein